LTAVRQAILLVSALALGACSSGQLVDHRPDANESPDANGSPGTVTFRLVLPSTRSFCDHLPACQLGVTHVSVTSTIGEPIQTSPGVCPTYCSAQCTPLLCPLICPISSDVALTNVEGSWDGSYYEASTCGSNTACLNKRFVAPSVYVVQMCATPGTLAEGDAGPPTCTPSGREECAGVPFMFPSPSVVEASLPDTIN